MRTLKTLHEFFKKHNMSVISDYDSGFKYNIGGIKRTSRDSWGSGTYYEGGTYVGCEVSQATWCCGVMEMGEFTGYDKPELEEHWKAIIEYAIQKKKLQYLRTETITQKDQHVLLDKVLENLGFRMVTSIPSAHGKRHRQKYDIHVWEWLKK